MTHELDPLWALTGIFVILYALFVLLGSAESFLTRLNRWRNAAKMEHVVLPRATIARDLAPKLRTFLPYKPTFYITAGDGHPLTTRKIYPWPSFIREALECGSRIYYLVADATVRDKAALLQRANELRVGNTGELHFYFLDPLSIEPDDEELVDTFRTFHVVLIGTHTARAMWIEAYHPANSTVAYGCEFVPPELAATDARYDEYMAIITKLIAKYGSPKQSAQAA